MKQLDKLTGLAFVMAQLAGVPAIFGQAAAPAVTGPRIQFSSITFDFGKVSPTDKPQHDFIFTNIGTAALEITDVHPGCGCTTAGTWDHTVQPGKTGRIPLQFNPANFNGRVSKGATVTCNDPVQGTYYLQFEATIYRPIDLQPQYAYFLPVEGEPTNDTKVIHIVNNQDEPITLEAPRSSNPLFKTEVKTVRPGKEFELLVSYSASESNTIQNSSITVNTSSTNAPSLSLTAMVMPQPAVIAVPQPIQLPPGPYSPEYRYPVTVKNNSRMMMTLSDPSINAEGVTIQVQEVEPGKHFTLNMGFPINFKIPAGQTVELSVKTSHPKYPILKLPVSQTPPPPPPAVPVVAPAATGAK